MIKDGIITKCISNLYTVKIDNEYIKVKPRGNFRNKNITPLVGDKVAVNIDKEIIEEIYERKNSLVRPPLANIDQVVVVTSVKTPDYSSILLDKMITVLEYNNITPIICFTKLDLCSKDELKEIKKIMKYYKSIGYKVITNKNKFIFRFIFKDKLTVFSGQSGAGKSTLLNKINKKLNLKTDDVSKALNRGKHTTRHVELFSIYNGLVSDTPGFSSLDISNIEKERLKHLFIDIDKYSDTCTYADCTHTKEKECNIKRLVDENIILKNRYDSYLYFMNENNKKNKKN